jgi:hypothetical protein
VKNGFDSALLAEDTKDEERRKGWVKDMLTVDRFRRAACQLDVLEECLDRRSLRKALASLPETLDETYRRIISSIPKTQKQYAIRILQFLGILRAAIEN